MEKTARMEMVKKKWIVMMKVSLICRSVPDYWLYSTLYSIMSDKMSYKPRKCK